LTESKLPRSKSNLRLNGNITEDARRLSFQVSALKTSTKTISKEMRSCDTSSIIPWRGNIISPKHIHQSVPLEETMAPTNANTQQSSIVPPTTNSLMMSSFVCHRVWQKGMYNSTPMTQD
jgi:hypothetical protein